MKEESNKLRNSKFWGNENTQPNSDFNNLQEEDDEENEIEM